MMGATVRQPTERLGGQSTSQGAVLSEDCVGAVL